MWIQACVVYIQPQPSTFFPLFLEKEAQQNSELDSLTVSVCVSVYLCLTYATSGDTFQTKDQLIGAACPIGKRLISRLVVKVRVRQIGVRVSLQEMNVSQYNVCVCVCACVRE